MTQNDLPKIFNFDVVKGTYLEKEVEWLDSDGVPVDLTGYTAELKAKANYSDGSAAFTINSGAGEIVITESEGKLLLKIAAAKTSGLSAGRYVYDLKLTVGSEVKPLLKGVIQIFEAT